MRLKSKLLLLITMLASYVYSQELKIVECEQANFNRENLLNNLDSLDMVLGMSKDDTVKTASHNFYALLDSLPHDTIRKMIRNLPTRKLNIIKLRKENLAQIEKSDYCSFLLYVAIFDRLLASGLDLEFDYVRNRPYRSMGVGIGEAAVAEQDRLREKHRTYNNFLRMKESYRKYILNVFRPQKSSKSFENLVNSTIEKGKYHNPKVLKDILLSKYWYLTKDKLRRDAAIYYHQTRN